MAMCLGGIPLSWEGPRLLRKKVTCNLGFTGRGGLRPAGRVGRGVHTEVEGRQRHWGSGVLSASCKHLLWVWSRGHLGRHPLSLLTHGTRFMAGRWDGVHTLPRHPTTPHPTSWSKRKKQSPSNEAIKPLLICVVLGKEGSDGH